VTLSPALRDTLRALAAVMAEAQDDWWIISSAAVALYGDAPIHVGDVDVLLSAADARRIFPRIGIAPLPEPGNALFRSDIFGRWDAPPLTVEFMADFRYCRDGKWIDVAPASRDRIDVDGATLFVPAREELRALLLSFGRRKDLDRAALL